MGLSYAIHKHVSSSHSYSWEPRTSISSMRTLRRVIVQTHWQLSLLGLSSMGTLHTLIVGSFSKIVVWAFTRLALCDIHLCGLKVYAPRPCSTAKGTMFPLSICKRNFFKLVTLPHTTMGSDTICWGDNTLKSL